MSALSRMRLRFWFEAAFVVVSLGLWVATLIWPDWIELVFHVEPDANDGSLELALTILLPAIGLAVSFISAREWHRDRRVGQPEGG